MKRTPHLTSRRRAPWRIAAILLAGSAFAMLLPTNITRRAGDLLQVLVPFQDSVNRAADALPGRTENALSSAPDPIDAFRSTIDSLAADNRRLRRDLEQLTRVRARGLGSRGRLIPARVVSDDAAYWRRSKLILGGVRRGVTRESGVLTTSFSLEFSTTDGPPAGSAVLASECLIGIVQHVGTYTSRVRLLTDPQTRMPVAVGHVDHGTFSGPDAAFWLVGKGRDGIEVREVHHRYINDGSIKVGDTVLTRDDEDRLPPSVTVGRVTEILPDPDNPLLYTLKVSQPIDPETIRNVYVVDLTP